MPDTNANSATTHRQFEPDQVETGMLQLLDQAADQIRHGKVRAISVMMITGAPVPENAWICGPNEAVRLIAGYEVAKFDLMAYAAKARQG